MPLVPSRSIRAPWKPLLVLGCAFLVLGAEGEGNVTLLIAMLGAVLSVGGAGVGYGLTKAKADTAKERAEAAHQRIGHLESELADGVKALTKEFADFRLELARAGAMRGQPRQERAS